MNAPFKPASKLPFVLGKFHGPDNFNVALSRRSAFEGFERHTPIPCLHLSIVNTNEEVNWESWDVNGLGLIHQVTGYTEAAMREVVSHFFGDALAFEDAAWRFEMNSPNAARRQNPHAHLLVGHKDLFGEDGFVRQCVSSALKPERLAGEIVSARLAASTKTLTRAQGGDYSAV